MSNNTQLVYSSLRRRLMTGYYSPGAQIKEEHLAEELGVSRTPIRLALRQLVDDKMLIAIARRGVFVPEWTHKDITEVFELRCLLEPFATGLAAENAQPGQIIEMRQLTEEMEKAVFLEKGADIPRISTVNSQFHHLVMHAACAPRLKNILENLVVMPAIVGSFYLYTKEDILKSVQYHRTIIEAIESQDREYAELAMKMHLKSSHLLFAERSKSKRDIKPIVALFDNLDDVYGTEATVCHRS